MMHLLGDSMPLWLTGGSQLLISSWLIWYLFTRYLPRRDKEHQDHLDAQRRDFQIEMAEERKVTIALKESFERNLTANNQSHADQMCDLWERFDKMLSKHDQQLTKTVAEVKEIKKAE